MNFSTKEKTKLLDFIISLETLNKIFILEKEKLSFSSTEEKIFFDFYKNYCIETMKYQKEISLISGEVYSPTLQFLYRHFHQKSENFVANHEKFLKQFNKLNPDELKSLIINFLNRNQGLDENYTINSADFYSDEDVFEKIMESECSNEQKFNILYSYKYPKKYIETVNYIFENVYPIFSSHYDKAEKFFANKISDIKKLTKAELAPTINDFLGNEKLSSLLNDHYKKSYNNDVLSFDVMDENYNLEIAVLIFSYFRIVVIGTEHNLLNIENKNVIYSIGLFNFGLSKINKENDLIRKKILKALADDTRFDILRMIAYGFNTNKKLSEFFQISPPAITYQTNILKEASLIYLTDKGTFGINIRQLKHGFEKIRALLSIIGEN